MRQEANRAAAAARQVEHICPDCGEKFVETYQPQSYGPTGRVVVRARSGTVFCSDACQRRWKVRHGSLQGIRDVESRNQLASMMALVRAAQRTIDASTNYANLRSYAEMIDRGGRSESGEDTPSNHAGLENAFSANI
jgi:hypothetical protein